MANKDQKRGSREVRKPKQAKAPAPVAASAFIAVQGKSGKKK
jgi:hypothetical protein